MEMPVVTEQLLTPMVEAVGAEQSRLGQITQEAPVVMVVMGYQTLLELDRLFITVVAVVEEATIKTVLRHKVEMAEAEMVTLVTKVFLILPHMLILMVMQKELYFVRRVAKVEVSPGRRLLPLAPAKIVLQKGQFFR